jgi:hypothetical protein
MFVRKVRHISWSSRVWPFFYAESVFVLQAINRNSLAEAVHIGDNHNISPARTSTMVFQEASNVAESISQTWSTSVQFCTLPYDGTNVNAQHPYSASKQWIRTPFDIQHPREKKDEPPAESLGFRTLKLPRSCACTLTCTLTLSS